MSRTLPEISKDIENANALLKTELPAIPFGQRPAMHTAMINAGASLPLLLEELKNEVIPSRLVGLFATGDLTAINETIEFLTKSDGISLDANEMYRSIVDLVEPSYGPDRTFSTTQYSLMIRKVSDIGINLGYLEINPPKYSECICPDTLSTMMHVKKMLRSCKVGDQANIDLLTNKVVDVIVTNKISSKFIPVIITGVTSQEEKNAIATLFCQTTDHNFKKDFKPTQKTIQQLFKQQAQENQEQDKKEGDE